MSNAQKLLKYTKALTRPYGLVRKRRYILIVSHMRARTTLFSHILGSHEEICGHRELHLSYDSATSLLKMRVALSSEKKFDKSNYLLDKVLHNRLNINKNIFNDNLYLILMLRPPGETMSSMIKMHRRLYNNQKFEHLVKYYKTRLNSLNNISDQFKGRFFYFDANELVTNIDRVLSSLVCFLDLKSPLGNEYDIFHDTGVAGKGDSGSNIKAGKIVNSLRNEYKFNLPDQTQKELDFLFNSCRENIINNSARSLVINSV